MATNVKKVAVQVPANAPYLSARLSTEIAYAVKGLVGGAAIPAQQTAFVNWLLFEVCRKDDLAYRPDSDRDTSFAEGKRYVAIQFLRAFNMTADQLAEMRATENSGMMAPHDDELPNT